jgi:catechol 2,3-dioxygenase-like lactoylglutathione lyase family enzyme
MDFTDLFAGVRVRDIAAARTWYERLLGSEPAFSPNQVEAVWAVGGHRWFYVLEDAPKAGCALVTMMVADLDSTVAAIAGRGIEPTALEDYGAARKYVFHDPDGNEIGIGQVPPASSRSVARVRRNE